VPAEKLPEGVEYWGITTKDHEGNTGVNGGLMKRHAPEQQGILNYVDAAPNAPAAPNTTCNSFLIYPG
jgi:hypothetical protein